MAAASPQPATQSSPADAVPVYNVPRPKNQREIDQIVVYGHSNLFYWWPVWLASFLLAGLTYAEGNQFAGVTISNSNAMGVIFVSILLVVAISSTVLFRGMMSIVLVLTVASLAIAFAWFGWWGKIIGFVEELDIRINAAGYLSVGIPLFFAWLSVVFIYDRQHYFIFGQGQIRYVLEVGDGEVVMPSDKAVVEKKRSDLFRHWVLGLGAGDLTIRSNNQNNNSALALKNVIGIHRKLTIINKLLREKLVNVE